MNRDSESNAIEAVRTSLPGIWPSGLFRLFSDGADMLLPRACAGCECLLHGSELGFCDPCYQQLPGRTAARCVVCGLRHDLPGPCDDCRRRPPAFDRTFVLCDYAPPIDHLIAALKFRRQLSLARALGEGTAKSIAATCSAAGRPATTERIVVTAVPLARMRLLERGFNQSQLIAGAIARRLAMPAPRMLLQRCRETKPQAGLHWSERQHNLRGAFECRAALEGTVVWLIDDVMTTGATLDAAAAALKKAGATAVIGIVAARTPLPGADGERGGASR